jgi:hypothetical protein
VDGTVSSVNVAARLVVLSTRDGNRQLFRTVSVPPATPVTIHGLPASLRDLSPGMKVFVQGISSSVGPVKAQLLQALTPASNTEVTGLVEQVVPTLGAVVVETSPYRIALVFVPHGAAISTPSGRVTVAGISIGQLISVSGRQDVSDATEVLAGSVALQPINFAADLEGSLRAVDATRRTVTIGKASVVIHVPMSAPVLSAGEPSALSVFQLSSIVRLRYERDANGKIVRGSDGLAVASVVECNSPLW